jgi:hypothetical protein
MNDGKVVRMLFIDRRTQKRTATGFLKPATAPSYPSIRTLVRKLNKT